MRQDVTGIAGAAALLGLAITFLWAGLSKVSAVPALRDTLGRLGVTSGLTTPLAWGVITAELAAAVGLILTPMWSWPRLVVAVLATGFAAAGVVALAGRRRIECRCFGNVGAGRLGWRQVGQLPVLLGLAAVAQWRPPDWSVRSGLTGLAVISVVFLAVRVPGLLGPLRRLRADRVAMASTYQGATYQGVAPAPEPAP